MTLSDLSALGGSLSVHSDGMIQTEKFNLYYG